jgi:hypothetical protein
MKIGEVWQLLDGYKVGQIKNIITDLCKFSLSNKVVDIKPFDPQHRPSNINPIGVNMGNPSQKEMDRNIWTVESS